MSEDRNDSQPTVRLTIDAASAPLQEREPLIHLETSDFSSEPEVDPLVAAPSSSRPIKRRRLVITSPAIYQEPHQEAVPNVCTDEYVSQAYAPEPSPADLRQDMQPMQPEPISPQADWPVPIAASILSREGERSSQLVGFASDEAENAYPMPAMQQHEYESTEEPPPKVAFPETAFDQGGPNYAKVVQAQPGQAKAMPPPGSITLPQSAAAIPIRSAQVPIGTERVEERVPSHIPYMNIAPPYQAAAVRTDTGATPSAPKVTYETQQAIAPKVSYEEQQATALSYVKPFTSAQEPDDDDFGEDATMRFAPVTTEPMPTPATVPTTPTVSPEKRHSGFIIFLLTLTLLVSLTMVYITGVADAVLAKVGIPSWKQLFAGTESTEDEIPDIFSTITSGLEDDASPGDRLGENPSTVVSASASGVAKLKSLTVAPSSAKAPATLVFTIYSNETVTNIKLAKDDGEFLFAEGRGAPSGDGILWQFTAKFDEPYEGLIHTYLRDDEGWAGSGDSVQVSVQ